MGGGLQPGEWVYSSDPPPPYNSEGFLGWALATPSFFGHRSLLWLFAGTMPKSLCGCGVFVGSSEQAKREHLKNEKH